MLGQAGKASRNLGSVRDETALMERAQGFSIIKRYLIEKVVKCGAPPGTCSSGRYH
jgi:hypothetical protein